MRKYYFLSYHAHKMLKTLKKENMLFCEKPNSTRVISHLARGMVYLCVCL